MNARGILSDESLALLPGDIEVISAEGNLYAVLNSGNAALLSDVLGLLGASHEMKEVKK